MCQSPAVSLSSALAMWAGAWALWRRGRPNDRWLALFTVHLSLVQLLEFVAWRRRGGLPWESVLLFLVICLEPASSWALGARLGSGGPANPWPLVAAAAVLTLGWIVASWPEPEIRNEPLAPRCGSRHLHWPWMRGVGAGGWALFTALLVAPVLLFMRPRWPAAAAVAGVMCASSVWSALSYRTDCTASSMWCLAGVGLPAVGWLVGGRG